jgi:superfamily II DNA helicase RecQ
MYRGRGWIVVTDALETGINIKGIVYIVYIDWLYRLTSFVQQSGQGGQNRKVSNSIIIVQVQHSSKHKQKKVISNYLVESIDEEAIVGFIQSQTCQQRVLSHYLDRESSRADCKSTDSVFCNYCKVHSSSRIRPERESIQGGYQGKGKQKREQEPSRQEIIRQRLRALQEAYNSIIKAID